MEPMELSWNEEFWSHPGVLLSQHLSAVGKACKEFFSRAGVNDERQIRLAELVGKSHDFGKYTPFFQRYVRRLKVSFELKEHSSISALFSAWLIKRELEDDFFALTGFICTLKHHGNLNKDFYDLLGWLEDNFGDETGEFSFDVCTYTRQIESLRKNLDKISAEMEKIGIHRVEEFIDELPNTYSWLMELLFNLAGEEIEGAWKRYFTMLLLFSALVDADRRDATQLKEVHKREKLDPDLVDIYREKEFKTPTEPLDPLRNKVYEDTINSLKFSDDGFPKSTTITAPTGIGKTLLALSITLKLRKQICNSTGNMPRIIYVLPYINIIEQTYDVFSQVLNAKKKTVSPYLLLKHHHQHFLEEGKDDIPLDEVLLLHEAWESEIIVSTFVQFFHALIGGHKHFLRKFHNMFNSIVILDEVQTIPMEYWGLVSESIEKFLKNSNYVVIAMTATKPIIFSNNWTELVPHYQEVFEKLDRVNYSYFEKKMKVSEMVNWFLSEIWSKEPSSALIVLNTISSSIETYRLIKEAFLEDEVVGLGEVDENEKIKDTGRVVIAHLSTNIVPAERKRRIELIKDLLKENRKIIVVSTQVIEAGVDLNFRVAIRDIGPIDSIIQVAGRCNRSGGRNGNMHVVRIIKDDNKLDAPKIYGSLSIWIAKSILENHCKFHEKDILKITDEYFEEGYERKSQEKSKKILEAIKKLNFPEVSEFMLIEEEPKESVFIELNGRARKTLENFEKILEKLQKAKKLMDLKKIFECKVELRKARTDLEAWIVAIRDKQRGRLPPGVIINGIPIWYVSESKISEYYDRETGYISSFHAAVL